jgi:hypothetical protein
MADKSAPACRSGSAGMGRQYLLAAALVGAMAFTTTVARAGDPLPSWNDGKAKQSIIDFVAKVTKAGSPDFVPVAERIAVFDNDGTLWCEQPIPVQLYFALDRVKTLAPLHPEWKTKEPFVSLLKGDLKAALAGGEHALIELVMATHTGMTTVEFEQIVWVQDLRRVRRRHRVHAPVDGAGVWHPARTSHRQQRQDEVRDARQQAGDRAPAGVQLQ